jgi:hypothetical protein
MWEGHVAEITTGNIEPNAERPTPNAERRIQKALSVVRCSAFDVRCSALDLSFQRHDRGTKAASTFRRSSPVR